MKYKFIVEARRWFEKLNGNTYHSVKVTDIKKGTEYFSGVVYGYGNHYRQTALQLLLKYKKIPKRYNENYWMYERENQYPIYWSVTDVKRKKDLKF